MQLCQKAVPVPIGLGLNYLQNAHVNNVLTKPIEQRFGRNIVDNAP